MRRSQGMFQFLGRFATRHPWKILCAWIVIAISLTAIAPNWKTQSQDDDIRFLPDRYPSVRAHQLIERAFPKDVSACRAIFAIEREEGPLTAADLELVNRLAERLQQFRLDHPSLPITGVYSYRDGPVGTRLTSNDRQCTLIQLAFSTPYLALQTREAVDRAEAALRPLLDEAGAAAPRLFTTGPAGIGRDLTKASEESLKHTTLATIVLVVVVLLLVYRSPLLALIPLVTIGLAVWVSLQLLALATLIPGVHVVNVSRVFCIVILFGAGTDYCLFLISRFREELELGQEPASGVVRAVAAVGGALAASAGTVIVGLGMMGFAEFGKIRCAGPVIALGLVVGLCAALTITPALLCLGKKIVFWPRRIRFLAVAPSRNLWNKVSAFVVRRPGWVLAVSVLPLAGLSILGFQVTAGFNPIGDLSSQSGSVRGLAVIQKHYTAGETGPMTVLLASRVDWNSPEGREVLERLSVGFGYLPNVAEVRSLVQPLGKPLEMAVPPTVENKKIDFKNLLSRARQNIGSAVQDVARRAAQIHYSSKYEDDRGPLYVTRLDLILHTDPFDAASVETLDLVETWLAEMLPIQTAAMGSVRAETSGVTVYSRDVAKAVAKDRKFVNVLVMVGVFIILLALVRRVWLAGYLLATVLLSYFATLGLTAIFTMWLTGRPFGVIEWRVPFFLFIILVAIGEDYNILLVTRILQERKKHGMIEGVRRGLAATGGTITACGLIMAGTFGTLMLADLSTLKQIGFALAVGVLLDTFVVRPLMVPAFLLIVWKDSECAIKPRDGHRWAFARKMLK